MEPVFTCVVAIRSADPERARRAGGVSPHSVGRRLGSTAQRYAGRNISSGRGQALGEDDPEAAFFVFDEAVSALLFSLAVHEIAADEAGGSRFGEGATLKAGLHGAPASRQDAALPSDAVPISLRLANAAPPGGIVVSEQVRRRVGTDVPVRFHACGRLNGEEPDAPVEMSRAERSDPSGIIRFGAFELDAANFELRHEGAPVPVEPRTFDLIALLARKLDRTVTKDEIFRTIWGGRIVSDAALSSQIKAARRALGDDGTAQSMITTVHGRGFRLRAGAAREVRPAIASLPLDEEAQRRPPRTRRPTVALTPCANLDEDGRGAIVAQGLTEDLINALSKNRWLRVVTRNPVFALGGATDDIVEIAAKLGADYIVSGAVRRAGSRVRITMQATDARNMRCIWSEAFDREMRDIFALQDEISALVAARIATELGMAEQRKAERTPRTNLGAWELYQLGSAEFYRFTPESNRRCRDLMRQAIRIDPEFAEPCSRLAYAMILEMIYFEGPLDSARMDEALRFAERGVALDDQDANAFFSLGRVRLARREYDLAIDALEHAVTLNPCHALSCCGLGDSLAYEGRVSEALRHFDRAIALSPHDPFRWAFMSYRSLAHMFAGEFDHAAMWARRATQVPNGHYWARANLVSALGHLAEEAQIDAARNSLMEAHPRFSRAFAEERMFFIRERAQLDAFLEGLRLAGIP